MPHSVLINVAILQYLAIAHLQNCPFSPEMIKRNSWSSL